MSERNDRFSGRARPPGGPLGDRPLPWANILRLISSLLLASSAFASEPLDAAWELTSQTRLREAATAFQAPAVSGQREAELGAAVVELELPPTTPEKTTRAREKLAALVAAKPNDETGLRARYLLGRLRQLSGTDDDENGAPELVALAQEHPAHYFAQLATIKLAQHRLYATSTATTPAQRLAAAEKDIPKLTRPELLRDFHLVLGDAYLFFGDQRAAALPHYRAAEALGIPEATVRATVLVQIGELARLENQPDVAIAAYRQFLKSYRRDLRAFEIRKRLAALEAATP